MTVTFLKNNDSTRRRSKFEYLNISTFVILLTTVVSAQDTFSRTNGKPGVYALPEISIKLRNGTELETTQNAPLKLAQSIGYIQMTCTADYPVKWEYLVNNKSIPVVDVVYRRLIRNMSDFNNPKESRFMSMITLRGLLESQTGKYLCRHWHEKLNNNSYTVASYFDVFIPGNRTFNAISSVSFVNKTTSKYVDVHCPVTDFGLHVRLYKLNEQYFSKTGDVVWKPIYANYEPTDGFRLLAGLGRELLGTYNCTADNGASMVSVVADLSEKEHYQSLDSTLHISQTVNSSCRENYKFVQYIRSRRLECYCQDSFGLFMNANYDFQNRQANCSSASLSLLQSQISNCSDWRLEEFINNLEDSEDVCFRGGITVQGEDDGTGSRPSVTVKGKTFPNGDNVRNFPFTKLDITYNGFADWAGDFMLAVCRKEVCFPENNDCSTGNNRTATGTTDLLEYFENEPTRRQYFPLAHHQAVWNDLIINGKDVKLVYVLQAHSLSYAWFPYATARIEWEKEQSSSVSMTENMAPSPFDRGQQMMSTSSSSTLKVFMLTSYAYLLGIFAVLTTS